LTEEGSRKEGGSEKGGSHTGVTPSGSSNNTGDLNPMQLAASGSRPDLDAIAT